MSLRAGTCVGPCWLRTRVPTVRVLSFVQLLFQSRGIRITAVERTVGCPRRTTGNQIYQRRVTSSHAGASAQVGAIVATLCVFGRDVQVDRRISISCSTGRCALRSRSALKPKNSGSIVCLP